MDLTTLGLTVLREIPNDKLLGLATGQLTLHGGVIRDGAGRIVAHLAMPAATAAFNAVPGLGLMSDLVTHYQLRSIAVDVQKILNVSLLNTALSGLTFATSVVGFAYVASKLRQVENRLEGLAKQSKEIKQFLQSGNEAKLRAAIDSLRHSSQTDQPETRRQLLLAAKGQFTELAHHFAALTASMTEVAEVEAAEDCFVIACLGSVSCTSDLGLHEAAREDLVVFRETWRQLARHHAGRLLQVDSLERLLDSRYVDALPTATLIRLLDFTKGSDRGLEWIDEMRRATGTTTKLTSALRTIDTSTIELTKKLQARDDVLQSYVAHFAFLADKKLSASEFAGLIEQERQECGAELLWVAAATLRMPSNAVGTS